ncbi:MAG: chromosomal replication initiator protein DnaA [Bacteroidales bacterium]|jgi:chromosomal replication initiator protein|nr:chromosomal replication initiator protein DnaA [Bacteroidales bacterium]
MKETIDDFQAVWDECLKMIKENISQQSFETWFHPIKPISLSGQVLTIQVPTFYYHEYIEGNFWKLLKAAIQKVLGPNGKLEYNILITSNGVTTTLPRTGIGRLDSQNKPFEILVDENTKKKEIPNPFVLPGLKKLNIQSQLNKVLTFENFIEGDCNRLARTAGYAIANEPGKTVFNPFFVFSNVGLGKTHLVHAIGLEAKIRNPELIVLYVDAETFIQQYVEAAKGNNITDFVHFYQMLDILIIDDIHFLSEKAGTQTIFFHIFNHYHQKNKQIIITADKSPAEILGFEPRLLSRFKWGLTADLMSPDKITRTKIIKSKLYNNGIDYITEEVIEYLACRIVTNIREIEGAIIQILAESSLNKKEITVELAKQIIDKFVRGTAHEISVDYIQKVVCDYFKVPVSDIFSASRKRKVVQVRQAAMYFAKKFTVLSLAQIGERCGNKDHATVLHACRTISDLKGTDKEFRADLEAIDKIIKNS